MQELIKNAWTGWTDYIAQGKLAALFLAALLFCYMRREKDEHGILLYGGVVSLLCICPVTGAVLMKYQTRFYNYQWIWNLVPVTLVIAFAITVLLTNIWERYNERGVWRRAGFTALAIGILILCGDMGTGHAADRAGIENRQSAKAVLKAVEEQAQGQQICLWAPQEIMEAARSYSGEIGLVYGRDMWDLSLGAYTYDVYDENRQNLYLWMQEAEDTGEMEIKTCLEAAKAAGANCILLPGNMGQEMLEGLKPDPEVHIQMLEGYYFLMF